MKSSTGRATQTQRKSEIQVQEKIIFCCHVKTEVKRYTNKKTIDVLESICWLLGNTREKK